MTLEAAFGYLHLLCRISEEHGGVAARARVEGGGLARHRFCAPAALAQVAYTYDALRRAEIAKSLERGATCANWPLVALDWDTLRSAKASVRSIAAGLGWSHVSVLDRPSARKKRRSRSPGPSARLARRCQCGIAGSFVSHTAQAAQSYSAKGTAGGKGKPHASGKGKGGHSEWRGDSEWGHARSTAASSGDWADGSGHRERSRSARRPRTPPRNNSKGARVQAVRPPLPHRHAIVTVRRRWQG